MKGKAAIVLIPGAGMSSWIWRDVAGRFSLPAIAIDDRLQPNTYAARKSSSLGDCVRQALSVIEKEPYDSYVVLGHSGAGPIAAKLAQALGERAAGAIYVAANLPAQGRTMIDSLPWAVKLINVIAIKRMIKKDRRPYAPMEKIIREKFCNDSPASVIDFVLAQEMRSEPLCAITEKMDWSGYRVRSQAYLATTRDGTLSLEKQRAMAGNLGITNIVEVEGDHMVMLSRPEEFARAVDGIVAAFAAAPGTASPSR